ncbi:MAG: hypothetical protein ACLSG7_00990 [Clostridia bacterium]
MLRNKDKGITLIALVITIIILLILAGISISALTNQGLFKNAKIAQNATEKAEKEQGQRLNEYEDEINKYLNNANEDEKIGLITDNINKELSKTDNTKLKDEKGNRIVVPAGFKIVNGATTVDKGIVIEDVTETATKGSQFVWIPVGTITKSDGTTATITLGRYDFDSTTGKESAYSGSYIEEDANDASTLKKWGNTIAKNITNFKNSVATNGGYYIGRYEARTATARNAAGNALTQITEKGTENVYNYVTQLQAAQLSQNMYNSDKFTSDLTNSYAWDTAIVFIQNCGTNTKYSRQNRLNTSLAQTGTNSLTDTSKIDVQCNIYDMASNIVEWTTETSGYSSYPCVSRGGYYNDSDYCTSGRDYNNTSVSSSRVGFRPLLYL